MSSFQIYPSSTSAVLSTLRDSMHPLRDLTSWRDETPPQSQQPIYIKPFDMTPETASALTSP